LKYMNTFFPFKREIVRVKSPLPVSVMKPAATDQ